MIWWCDNGANRWTCLTAASTAACLLPLSFCPSWGVGSYKPSSLLPSPMLVSHGLMPCDLRLGRCSPLMLPFTYCSCSYLLLMLSHLHLPTATAYKRHHSHCSYSSSCGVGFGWDTEDTVIPSPLYPARETTSLPLLISVFAPVGR